MKPCFVVQPILLGLIYFRVHFSVKQSPSCFKSFKKWVFYYASLFNIQHSYYYIIKWLKSRNQGKLAKCCWLVNVSLSFQEEKYKHHILKKFKKSEYNVLFRSSYKEIKYSTTMKFQCSRLCSLCSQLKSCCKVWRRTCQSLKTGRCLVESIKQVDCFSSTL